MRSSEILTERKHRVLALAAARGATAVRVFGRVASGKDHEGSDLDLLVDLPMGTSRLTLVGWQQELADDLGVAVDLCTERKFETALKARILAEARAL